MILLCLNEYFDMQHKISQLKRLLIVLVRTLFKMKTEKCNLFECFDSLEDVNLYFGHLAYRSSNNSIVPVFFSPRC